MTFPKSLRLSHFVIAATCFYLTACGSGSQSGSQPQNSANVTGKAAQNSAAGVTSSRMVEVPLRPEQLDDPTNAGAKFEGCWYKYGRFHYQAVDVSVTNPGTYPFNADLYYGTTCDPKTQADQFGFGQELYFGGFGYILWFDAFANQSDMSAIWQVGTDTSKCVNYKTAPLCP